MSKLKKAKIKLLKRLKCIPLICNKDLNLDEEFNDNNVNINSYKPYINKIFTNKLLLKQRLRYNYCLHNKTLRTLIRKINNHSTVQTYNSMVCSHKKKTPDIFMLAKLFDMLEMRLDSILTRIGCAESILHAKQLISHGHVFVNNKIIKYNNHICNINDIIHVKEKKKLEIPWNSFEHLIDPVDDFARSANIKYIPFFTYEDDFKVKIVKKPSEYLQFNSDIECLYGAFEYYK